MDYGVVVVRHSEIALKSRPVRIRFERQLVKNLERQTGGRAHREAARIILRGGDWEKVGNVFGVKSYSPAILVPADLEEMKRAALSLYNGEGSFAVRTRRVTKDVPWTSPEINRIVGGYLKEKTGARVDLKNAELNVGIEIINGKAYVFRDVLPGPGGLPVGVAGRVLHLFSGGIDSPVAAWRLAKRGVHPTLLFVNVAGAAQEALVYEVYGRLAEWFPYLNFYVIEAPDVLDRIVDVVPEGYRQVVFKAFLYRVADAVAEELDIPALSTGEVLSQVSTQTLDSLVVLERFTGRPVFRPLISYDKDEIVALARQIGTLEASECVPEICVLSRHSITNPRLEKVEMFLNKLGLDWDDLVDRLREARRPVAPDVLFRGQSLKGYEVVNLRENPYFVPERGKRYVLVCPSGSVAAAKAEVLRRQGFDVYAVDEKTYRRLLT
ncbi:TPA: hypothetical protein EYP13_01555 [Candidatus Micrarchaeota archaeon]|nr:hypothetical protein [Candidatus Micrarchaeota archaeon]